MQEVTHSDVEKIIEQIVPPPDTISFHLDAQQTTKFREWKSQQIAKVKTRDATGFRFTFSFTPSGLGDTIKVLDLVTKEELDLTDLDF